MRPTVAILSSNFWPEQTGSSQTVYEFARYLAESGVEVRVATSMPYYPEWQIRPEFRGKIWSVKDAQGMRIYRSWHRVRPAPSTVTRLLHELTLSLFAVPNIIRALHNADVAYVVSPALTYALTSAVLAWALRVRRVLVVKDVMPDAAVELGMLRNPMMIRLSSWLAKRLYAVVNEIQTLGEGMRRRIAKHVRGSTQVHVVPDTIDADELSPIPLERNEFRRRFVPSDSFVVLHTGNMGKKQDLNLLLRVAERLRDEPHILFYVFGDGAVRQEFLQARDARGLPNVKHYPLQDRWLVPHMLSGADVVLVSQLPEVVDIVVPSKLVTALGAGGMIVAACARGSETARMIRESSGGIWIPASDDAALASAILEIRSGAIDIGGYRRRAREYALNSFERQRVYQPLLRACQELSRRSGDRAAKSSEAKRLEVRS